MTIEVDPITAEIIRRAQARAQSQGETLASYLQHALEIDVVTQTPRPTQEEAWNAFVAGMTAWGKDNIPPGHVIDDSRDAMYEDRN